MRGKPALTVALIALMPFAAMGCASAQRQSVRPQSCAHAHNDYEHPRPLFDAVEHGFCSVEADVHLVDGQLLVAHDIEEARPGRTLEGLYLAPLRELVRRNGGALYPHGPSVILLIDFKSGAEPTYEALKPLLKRYKPMLTRYRGDRVYRGPVTVLISGNRPTRTVAGEAVRYVAIDGRAEDLESNPPAHLVPLISENWTRHFEWQGAGPFPEAEAIRLRAIVMKAHAQGRKVRFWSTADRPEVWDALLGAGVDLIGADDLGGLERYLRETGAKGS